MALLVYYDSPQGVPSNALEAWVRGLLAPRQCDFRVLPDSNNSPAFTQLPSYVADILYLDKPDIIISGVSGVYERPICSIEFAGCTPQYQHAVQRFSRMMASAANDCPSVVIMPRRKVENQGGARAYNRSAAISYGASKLMDIFGVPAHVLDWPDEDGVLLLHDGESLPPLNSNPIRKLRDFVAAAVLAFETLDFVGTLSRSSIARELLDATREDAYRGGAPTIANPGGGVRQGGAANLELIQTDEFIARLQADGRADPHVIGQIPPHIRGREQSLLFYPTRLVRKAGDPYVGMMSYYDIAFCRDGRTPRDRRYNLIAYCNGVDIAEVSNAMLNFNNNQGNRGCPFVEPVDEHNLLRYSYHLRHGCSKTKTKPIRIYSELADVIAFEDGILVGT
jgi:hypothetical protein